MEKAHFPYDPEHLFLLRPVLQDWLPDCHAALAVSL
jgi:hypothetical protein